MGVPKFTWALFSCLLFHWATTLAVYLDNEYMLIPYVVEARYAYTHACTQLHVSWWSILKSVEEKMGIAAVKSCLQPLPHPIMNLVWPPIPTGWSAIQWVKTCFQWLGSVQFFDPFHMAL